MRFSLSFVSCTSAILQGNESAAEVDYAVNQDTPKTVKSLRDVTQGTINEDINYKKFLKSQKENAVNADDIDEEKPPWETMLEEIEKRDANPISVLVNFRIWLLS